MRIRPTLHIFFKCCQQQAAKKLDDELADIQSGFRKGRSTLDQLVRLVNVIRTGRLRKRKVLAVFLDLEKAFDLMRRSGVIVA